ITKSLEYFDVSEQPFASLQDKYNSVTVINNTVTKLNPETKQVECEDGVSYYYKLKLCICSGGRPKLIDNSNEHVLGLRDTDSASCLSDKLKNAKKVAVVGNGGIAMELAYEIRNCSVVWIIRENFVNHVFFDAASAKFIMSEFDRKSTVRERKKLKYKVEGQNRSSSIQGGALGPDWITGIELMGSEQKRSLCIETECEIERILSLDEIIKSKQNNIITENWPCYLQLTNKKIIGCDFIISATGVLPNYEPFAKIPSKIEVYVGENGGIIVDGEMRTGELDVYAAGDVCLTKFQSIEQSDWFQMRLWPQAKQMGYHAATCMLIHSERQDEKVSLPFCFEVFQHCTYFCGFKVILLGRFNSQNLDKYELMYRYTEGLEFIKLVIVDGKIRGAVIIGDLEMAETIENLMLSRIDVSPYGDDLLDSELVDLVDYFD
ncbi:hypothetical protein GJ496_000082, partial [Pomphorhynchus laevis]